MASCKVEDLSRDSKHLALASNEVTICGHDDTAEEAQSDTTNATHKNQTPGKFRRTAFRIFGVRKNICILPSLFGGRSKNQNKWSSKKGIGKSKTHDGLSKAMYDNSLGVGYTSSGNLEYLSQKDATEKLDNSSYSEYIHPVADQKSLSLPRQKKGLRSLFQSIRYHRNHRNVELEKNEMIAMSSPLCLKEVPAVKDSINQNVMQCLGSLSELVVPDLTNVACDVTIVNECNDDRVTLEASVLKQEESLPDDQMADDQMEETKVMSVISDEYAESSRAHSESCPQLHMSPEPKMKSQVPTGSSDQLDLIFEDVESLKSFDSLTGCGDIIADQDDDSIAESTVSGERSRNAGKRNSCYLTYQGGGEEMASPDNLDGESLHDLWGNKAQEEVCCTCNKDHNLPSSHQLDFVNSNCGQAAGNTDTSPIADVLTPQSDHQESVPNSDEGYYDSTTPGPDEGQEKVERTGANRLPRDSYSGDALYELFAPDESLISPLYENQSKLPDSESCQYLAKTGDMEDSAFAPEKNTLQLDAELYKSKDFDNVLKTELPNMSSISQELAQFTIGAHDKSSKNINSSPQASFENNQMAASDEKGNMLPPKDIRNKSTNSELDRTQGHLPFVSTSHSDYDSFSLPTFCEAKEHLEEKNHVTTPYRAANTCSAISNDTDYGQTVCFSQALVDYTKHSQLLSNSHDDVDDLDNNSSLAQNMQALPTIVTFDVVDMHNEGEYDEQIHMEMEDDITSPYQQFEESYLQKDAFAECDHQLLDIYEQNLFTTTWAIASLPRNLGLTKTNQLLPNSLSLDRRSRSLDTESLELNMAAKYRENMAGGVSCPQTERNPKRESSVLDKKNVHISTSEVTDTRGIMSLPWQTKAERSLSPPLTDSKSERAHRVCQTQGIKTRLSASSTSDCYNGKSRKFPSSGSDRALCELSSQSSELCIQQCHLPLDPCFPHNAFVRPGITKKDLLRTVSTSDNDAVFYSSAISAQSYSQFSKTKLGAITQGMPPSGNTLNPSSTKEDIIDEPRPMRMLHPMGCLSEASLN